MAPNELEALLAQTDSLLSGSYTTAKPIEEALQPASSGVANPVEPETPAVAAFRLPDEDGVVSCTNQQYHSDRSRLSSSSLRAFKASIPLYYLTHVARTLTTERSPSAALRLGSALHSLVFEPELAAECVIVEDNAKGRSKAAVEARRKSLEINPDATLVTSEEFDAVQGMLRSLQSHPLASRLLFETDGLTESTVLWTDDWTNTPCKARFDKLSIGPWQPCIVDLKTSAEPLPEDWPRSAHKYGYHIQAAFYGEAYYKLYGEYVPHVFVVVGNTQPYEVVVYNCQLEFMEAGTEEVISLLNEMAKCKAEGKWDSRFINQPQTIQLPAWARKQAA